MADEIDPWGAEVNAKIEELKAAPVDEVPQVKEMDTIYGSIPLESTKASTINEQIREKASGRIRRLKVLLQEFDEIPSIHEIQRQHPYYSGHDIANFYREHLIKFKGHLGLDLTTAEMIVDLTVHADIIENRRNDKVGR